MKRVLAILLACMMLLSLFGCAKNQKDQVTKDVYTETKEQIVTGENKSNEETLEGQALDYLDPSFSTEERVSDLLSKMTLEDKAAQMVQGAFYAVKASDLKKYSLGSILSGGGGVPGQGTLKEWDQMMTGYQDAILSRDLKIPMLYGIDAVHGHSNVKKAVIFPHNIGLGAANNPELVKEMGRIVADEMKLTKIIWNFSPCIAIASDPRWGRTYESFSTDPEIVSALGKAYYEGQEEAGVVATAKHYLADGGVKYGTGNAGNLIDRGDAQMTEESLRAIYLKPYTELVNDGIDVIMASFSSFNGEPMHRHKYLLTDVLKTELGFKGFIVSDWEAIHLFTDAKDFNEQVEMAINAGVDMLMEPTAWLESITAIVINAQEGKISQERIDDAVRRILTVKFDSGLFEDPYLEATGTIATELGSQPYRDVSAKLVSESLVLLKNEGGALPLQKGQKIFVVGPAANNIGMQCGGWTTQWQGALDSASSKITQGTTILEGLKSYGEQYDVEFITDKSRISEADAIILALGEVPYAEWEGDTPDMSIVGAKASPENQDAIDFAKKYDVPVITLIIAGRQVIMNQFVKDWDSMVMCYLPGTEGQGIAPVLFGDQNFTGKLPMPWYVSVEDIEKENPDLLYEFGYGLTY